MDNLEGDLLVPAPHWEVFFSLPASQFLFDPKKSYPDASEVFSFTSPPLEPASHHEAAPLSFAASPVLPVAPHSPQILCLCLQSPPLAVTPSRVTVALVYFLLAPVLPKESVGRQGVCAGKANRSTVLLGGGYIFDSQALLMPNIQLHPWNYIASLSGNRPKPHLFCGKFKDHEICGTVSGSV